MKRLLSINEVAEVLNVKVNRVYAMAREGLLPVVRLGRQIRVDEKKLEQWIENGGKSLNGGWKHEND